jgi:pimeloyl-ACP methyl ester carboxylesterase
MAERRAHRERWVGALVNATIPLRLVDGPEDPVSGAHLAARYRELVPDADVVLLPGIGHYPQVEAPEQVVAAFLAFHDARVHS